MLIWGWSVGSTARSQQSPAGRSHRGQGILGGGLTRPHTERQWQPVCPWKTRQNPAGDVGRGWAESRATWSSQGVSRKANSAQCCLGTGWPIHTWEMLRIQSPKVRLYPQALITSCIRASGPTSNPRLKSSHDTSGSVNRRQSGARGFSLTAPVHCQEPQKGPGVVSALLCPNAAVMLS